MAPSRQCFSVQCNATPGNDGSRCPSYAKCLTYDWNTLPWVEIAPKPLNLGILASKNEKKWPLARGCGDVTEYLPLTWCPLHPLSLWVLDIALPQPASNSKRQKLHESGDLPHFPENEKTRADLPITGAQVRRC